MSGPIKHTAAMPFGFVATFTWRGKNEPMQIEWEPDVPCIRSPRRYRRFMAAYDEARFEFMQTVATTIGEAVLIADIRGYIEIVQPATKN
jgi:hypothetical protein